MGIVLGEILPSHETHCASLQPPVPTGHGHLCDLCSVRFDVPRSRLSELSEHVLSHDTLIVCTILLLIPVAVPGEVGTTL